MKPEYDVCIVGSGAGAGPVAYELAHAGYRVLVIEKGPWLTEKDFTKDEIACCRRNTYTPELKDEPHAIEQLINGEWKIRSNASSGWSFWNGNMVGGSSNLMSGFFHRMKPIDFRLLSEFGTIERANVVDWPIEYKDLEPYYEKTERIVGVSGRVVDHPFLEPRSTPDYPFPPSREHHFAKLLEQAGAKLSYQPIPLARAILTNSLNERSACIYSGYCGSYGCTSKAKGSSRAALLDPALKTGNCEIRPNSKVYFLESDSDGMVNKVHYYDLEGKMQNVQARIVVVACQAVETSRLLLLSKGKKHPNGLGNNHQQVGKNLLFSAGGIGSAEFHRSDFEKNAFESILDQTSFVNRALQDWYVIHDYPEFMNPIKGGTIDFLMGHANPIRRAVRQKRENGKLLWGESLKEKLEYSFHHTRRLEFEVFCDWLPTENCFVSLDETYTDRWQTPVARIRLDNHPHDIKVGEYLAEKAKTLLKEMGGRNIVSNISGLPPANLMAGGCRFGNDIKESVLDANCRIHDAPNVFVTDGSFMPTGGSVTHTFTIYANSFRVADKIKEQL